jgi:hypothetical protein
VTVELRRARAAVIASEWHGEGCGVDTVRVSVKVDRVGEQSVADTVQILQKEGAPVGALCRRKLPGGGVAEWHLSRSGFPGAIPTVALARAGHRINAGDALPTVRLEASLPKRVTRCEEVPGGSNVRPLPLGEVEEAVEDMIEEAGSLGLFAGRFLGQEEWRRVDAVRDFHDPEARQGEVLAAMASVPLFGHCKQNFWTDRERNSAETLTKGNATRRGTLYDKEREAIGQGVSALGQLRAELRLRTDALKGAGVVGLGTLGQVVGLVGDCWEWLGWGATVMIFDDAVREIVGLRSIERAAGVPGPDAQALVGFLVTEALGVESVVSRRTYYRRKNWLRDHAISVEDVRAQLEGALVTSDIIGGRSISLDWAEGSVERRAA